MVKLENYAPLSSDERERLQSACTRRVRQIAAREDIVREGDAPNSVNVIRSGWACRYKQLPDGRRQTLAYFLPGDMCDLNIHVLKQMDHSVASLTPVCLAELTPDAVVEMASGNSNLSRALWWANLVAEAIEREWIVNLGQRTAYERLAHLFCEFFYRLRWVGLTEGGSCEMPLTQTELGDSTGLSVVHVNRTLQELRSDNLIILRGKTLTIPNLAALERAAVFSPNYLHFELANRELKATGS